MRRYFFTDRQPHSAPISQQFRTKNEALTFLRREAADTTTLTELRTWAMQRNRGVLSDAALLDVAAGAIVTGQLQVKTWRRKIKNEEGGAGTSSAPPEGEDYQEPVRKQPPPPRQKAPEVIRVRKPDPKPAAQPKPQVDVAKQVAALLAAAQSGAPFCEQCEKARREKESQT